MYHIDQIGRLFQVELEKEIQKELYDLRKGIPDGKPTSLTVTGPNEAYIVLDNTILCQLKDWKTLTKVGIIPSPKVGILSMGVSSAKTLPVPK